MPQLSILPPALPSWEGLHPLVVHFPVALLLITPLCVLLGFLPRVGRRFQLAALMLLILGTIGAYVAIESGEASAKIITFTPEARETLEQHQKLAEAVRLLFTILTVLYTAILLLPTFSQRVLKKPLPKSLPTICSVAFLIAAGLCVNVLANAAHLGGRLVYSHRVDNWILSQ